MSSRTVIFFVLLTGISALSTVVVVGFAAPAISSSTNFSPPCYATTTMLRYVAETNHNDEQYHRSRPHNVRVVDVEVEKQECVYIPQRKMADAVNKAHENHEQDCASMQSIINEQREELERLQEQNQKLNSANRLQYDHLADKADVNWGENHEAKMKRTTERVQYLINENQRLNIELDGERERFEVQRARLQQKLDVARDETAEAEQMLSLERSYFETAVKLLEVGLERESNNVKALEDHLLHYNQMGHHEDHHHPFYDDLPPFETWEASGAYQQQQEHHYYKFHHHINPDGQVFEEFQPKVRPQEVAPHCPQDTHIHSQHEAPFQPYESQNLYLQHDGQTTKNYAYARPGLSSTRNPAKATTTVMGAASIRDNLGINEIRDDLYH